MTSIYSHMNGGILLELVHKHLHTLFVVSWHKCVLHYHANKIGFHTNLSIEKCEIDSH